MRRHLPRLKKEADYDALFYDVAGTMPLEECYDEHHTMTRREDLKWRRKFLGFMAEQGCLVGTENGMAFYVPVADYFEGIGSISKALIEGVRVGVTPFETTPRYEAVNLGENYRIPLFQLVFHDAVYCTFRWNFTPDRYANKEMWKKHDLFVMMCGYMPIFVETDETLAERGQQLRKSAIAVTQWHEKIGMDELVDHRALTKDRKVQESRFSSGWAVVANFQDREYKLDSGERIPPMGCVTRKW